jgi:hypothetical protein
MSRDEVKGLNDLAMAHGGQLTINPQTGLPEAGFLSSLLPMIGGAALSAMGMPPMMASLVMGGVTGVASGSLSKGLMAGLGAYGGAGMMGGLIGAGQGALAAQGVQAGMPQFAGDTAAYAQQVDALRSAQLAKAAEAPLMDQAKAGFSQIGDAPGDFFKNNWKYAAAAAAPVLAAPQTTTKQPEVDKDPGQRYEYSPGRVEETPTPDPFGREQTYFKPKFAPITQPTAKSIYGFAGGGPVEAMSNANAIGANTGYPMADINKGAYATPYQTPISRNVLSGVSDTGVNPMTGEMNFAAGGNVQLQGHVTLDGSGGGGGGGQFGQSPANGYQAVGSGDSSGNGFGSGFGSGMLAPAVQRTGQFGQTNNQGLSSLLGLLGNLGGRAQSGGNNMGPMGGMERPSLDAPSVLHSIKLTPEQMAERGEMYTTYGRFKEGGSVASYQDGGVATATPMPDQYSYDPLTQMFNKIESMPSDNQPKPKAPQMGGNQGPMSDAAFAKQQSEGQKNMQAIQDGTMMSRIGDSLSEGLSFMAKNGPTMALINAITSAISGQSGSSSGAGFGAPGATSGNAGAMGFGPSGMAGGFGGGSTGATGGGGGGGGAPGAPGLGASSGGGYATGPGGTAGVGGTAGAAAGAARGGLMAAYANGGSHLGDYSDGGRLLKGPGDGVSDSIPAMIGKKQPARLADGEFVVPARIVSELGNGSTEAGARKLYAMMDRVQKARGKTVGKGKVAKNSRSEKYLPA